MGCGCNKNKQQQAVTAGAAVRSAPQVAARVALYQVLKDGEVVLVTTSPQAARAKARSLPGSTVRVTSTDVNSTTDNTQELASAGQPAG